MAPCTSYNVLTRFRAADDPRGGVSCLPAAVHDIAYTDDDDVPIAPISNARACVCAATVIFYARRRNTNETRPDNSGGERSRSSVRHSIYRARRVLLRRDNVSVGSARRDITYGPAHEEYSVTGSHRRVFYSTTEIFRSYTGQWALRNGFAFSLFNILTLSVHTFSGPTVVKPYVERTLFVITPSSSCRPIRPCL